LHLLDKFNLRLKFGIVGCGQGIVLELAGILGTTGTTAVFHTKILEPGHIHDLLHVGSLSTVLLEHGSHYIDGLVANLLPGVEREIRRILDSLSRNLLVLFIVERKYSRKE
jgi:hypothetical protein